MIKVANDLDKLGYFEEANDLTRLAYDFSNPEKEEIVDDSFAEADEFEELERILKELKDSGEITFDQMEEVMDIVKPDNSMEVESLHFEGDDDSMDEEFDPFAEDEVDFRM